MRRITFFLFILVLSSQLQALLPPLYQNIAEIEAIFKDEKLTDFLTSADVIEKIEKISDGYEITTNQHRIAAAIIVLPQSRPGPAKFKVQFSSLQ